MGDEHDRAAGPFVVPDPALALLLEGLVADGEHLVEEQDVGLDVHRDREAQTQVHAGRVGLDGLVGEVLQLGERDDLVQVFVDVLALDAEHGRVEVDVLDAGEVGAEARTDLEQRADAAVDADVAFAGWVDARDQLQQRRLAAAVLPHDAERLARQHVDVDAAQCPQLPLRHPLALDQHLLQRAGRLVAQLEVPAQPAAMDRATRRPDGIRVRRQGDPRTGAAPTARTPPRTDRRRPCRSARRVPR